MPSHSCSAAGSQSTGHASVHGEHQCNRQAYILNNDHERSYHQMLMTIICQRCIIFQSELNAKPQKRLQQHHNDINRHCNGVFWLVGWCWCLQLGPANSADFVSAMQAGATAWLPSPLTAHMLQAQIIAQVGMHAEKWQAFLVWLCRTLHGVWFVVCPRDTCMCRGSGGHGQLSSQQSAWQSVDFWLMTHSGMAACLPTAHILTQAWLLTGKQSQATKSSPCNADMLDVAIADCVHAGGHIPCPHALCRPALHCNTSTHAPATTHSRHTNSGHSQRSYPPLKRNSHLCGSTKAHNAHGKVCSRSCCHSTTWHLQPHGHAVRQARRAQAGLCWWHLDGGGGCEGRDGTCAECAAFCSGCLDAATPHGGAGVGAGPAHRHAHRYVSWLLGLPSITQ